MAWWLLLACAPYVVDEIDESCPIAVGDALDLEVDKEVASVTFPDLPALACVRDGQDFDCEHVETSDLTAFDADATVETRMLLGFSRRSGELTGEIRFDTTCAGSDCDALDWPACGLGDEPSPFHAAR